MSGIVTQSRNEITDATKKAAGDIPVHTSMPPTLYPPCILITEANPFITPDDTYTGAIVNYELVVLAGHASDNAAVLDRLDGLVDALVEGLWHEYGPTVGGYQTFTFANQQPYLGARIEITANGYQFI